MDTEYKILKKQKFIKGDCKIVPIRTEDRYDILKWRNEQIFHLRQNKVLTKEDQDHYFSTTVAALFQQEQPTQILFSYLQNNICIGYGGLVHMNWVDKNAEISFITNTELKGERYAAHMSTFLSLLEDVAFKELKLHKLFTYAFDLRPHIYPILENSGFEREAVLHEHCYFEGEFRNVIIHSKLNRIKI